MCATTSACSLPSIVMCDIVPPGSGRSCRCHDVHLDHESRSTPALIALGECSQSAVDPRPTEAAGIAATVRTNVGDGHPDPRRGRASPSTAARRARSRRRRRNVVTHRAVLSLRDASAGVQQPDRLPPQSGSGTAIENRHTRTRSVPWGGSGTSPKPGSPAPTFPSP
jgi:hypothetical protein